MDKTAIKNFAVKARKKLIKEITYKAYEVGIQADEIMEIESFAGGFRVKGRERGKTFKKYELQQREELVERVLSKGFKQVIEEVAYTWFNRFIALRFMEINNYLPTGVRVLSSMEKGRVEPDIVREALNIDLDVDREIIFRLQDEDDNEDLYKYLLIRQCNQLGQIMPSVFEEIADYTELLLPDKLLADDSVIRNLVEEIEEYDWKVEVDDDAEKLEAKKGEHGIEIIGWLYQYYVLEKKDEVFAGLRKNQKITKENIPAATQLFTPKWIVKYMVENSLGRLWLESHPNEELQAKWKYYLEEAEQEPEVEKQLDELKNPNLSPEDIKILDPAMGSGHILIYAFDLLYEIYLERGYSEREISTLILEKNLYGLDIDDRAGQLASFALLMKARSKNRRIFRNKPKLNLYAIQESNHIPQEAIEYLVNPKETGLWLDKHKRDVQYLMDVFHDAKEYGSILDVKAIDFHAIEKRIEEIKNEPMNLFEQSYKKVILEKIVPLIGQAKLMSQEYDVVCTNPPYMGRRGMNPELTKYLDVNFKDSKSDLFAVFMELDDIYLEDTGFMGMINQHSWMFLSSYEGLRQKIIENRSILNMVHLGAHAFEEIGGEVVQSTAFVYRKKKIDNFKGNYIRLVDINNADEKEDKVLEIINCPKSTYYYEANQDNLKKIPGSPIAYWVSDSIRKAFEDGKPMNSIIEPKQGLATADNNRFLRLWHETNYNRINFQSKSIDDSLNSKAKWFPYNKGGARRQWYGNYDYIVNWENDGFEIRNFKDKWGNQRSVVRNPQFYFKEAITWSLLTSGGFSIRYRIMGSIHDVAGMSAFADNHDKLMYLLGLMGTKISSYVFKILNPTINLQVGDFNNFPVLFADSKLIIKHVKTNINISKTDWDSFETSWDFKLHPLADFNKYMNNYYDSLVELGILADREPIYVDKLEDAYEEYKEFTKKQFDQLKANEEELNSIFIEIYGLEDELTPEVSDKDITISKVFDSKEEIYGDIEGNNYILTREDVIKSFISYAVGCMFGRYSLDEEGLIYAGGDWGDKFRLINNKWELKSQTGWKKSSIDIAEHNVIPITDGDYFTDDILTRLIDIVRACFGEDSLENNLDYIASSLGQRANETPRQAIRRYFLRGFYKDHVRTYKKRPIYWLFDSGRQNGFKALIYMHRYNPHTIARLRVDYLHNLQRAYEAELKHLDTLMASSDLSSREKNAAKRQRETISKRIIESRQYDEVIAHMANKQLAIDLDDGVKVNYAKFQKIEIPSRAGRQSEEMDLLAQL